MLNMFAVNSFSIHSSGKPIDPMTISIFMLTMTHSSYKTLQAKIIFVRQIIDTISK